MPGSATAQASSNPAAIGSSSARQAGRSLSKLPPSEPGSDRELVREQVGHRRDLRARPRVLLRHNQGRRAIVAVIP
jgi:hypothetical protein